MQISVLFYVHRELLFSGKLLIELVGSQCFQKGLLDREHTHTQTHVMPVCRDFNLFVFTVAFPH